MSIISDCSSDSTNPTLVNMTDLNLNITPIDPVVTQVVTLTSTDNSSLKASSELKNVGRNTSEWVPVSFSEIPISNNSLNIAINNNEIRSNITAITSNNRNIAPKPMTTTTNIPIRHDAIGDKTQTVIITTASDSSVNSSTTVNKYGINKVIPINNHIALVTSPDGNSLLAVPMSSLVTKGNMNLKPSLAPVSISNAALKSKPSIITPLKILPLIASTTTSASLTVPTISHSKNVQTLIAPASIAKGIATNTHSGVTIIPAPVSKSVLTLSTNVVSAEPTLTTSIPSTSSAVQIKSEPKSTDELLVKTEDSLQSPLPPLLAQNSSIASVPVTNSQTLAPPALTPAVATNSNNSPKSDNKNKSKTQENTESVSGTGLEEMDSLIQVMEWKDGIGVLPGSDLKFRVDQFGNLDMINELDGQPLVKNGIKVEDQEKDASEGGAEESDKTESNNEIQVKTESEPMLTCINCGERGPPNTFIRQGRFCSKPCATLESTQLKLITKRNAELNSTKTQEIDKKKFPNKKTDAFKGRKPIIEQTEQNPIALQTENSNQTIDGEVESNDDLNEDIEDFETEIDSNGVHFSWRQYLSKTNSMAAPVKCFNVCQTVPTTKNGFKVGMKLEGVDPQHPSKFCVLTVAEVCGFRLRLHFDGYKEIFDFWVNIDNNFIFAAGFCENTGRKLEPPDGIVAEEFNWNQYLIQTKSVAAPKQLFSTGNWQPSSVSRDGFKKGMKLEAVDRANSALVCVATVADIIDNWLLIHFDGWDDSYDYWAETSSPFIHAINWCRTKGRSLTPPKEYYRSSERFSWEEYLSETKSMAVSPRSFKTRPSNNFKVGMKLEAVDKRNPRVIRVCTISHRQSHSIKLHFDGWDEKYDYWVDDDCPDLHPVNWCHKTDHTLQTPPDSSLKKLTDGINSCPTFSCMGIGHIRGAKYLNHYSAVNCPYTDSRLEYELPDRIGSSSNRNSDDMQSDELDESRVSPSRSPSPSETNSVNSTSKSQKNGKTQNSLVNKPRKRKLGTSPNGTNGPSGPVSPSTNSESPKHSRPSTPSSVTNLSTLQHSIFAMRLSQQQQEAPVCWDRHSKTTLPGIDKTKSKDVLLWSPPKVAEFIDQIPGCESVGQIFQDQLIDGEAFLLLNQNDIVKILGLKLGPAIKIFNSILVIRDNAINEDVV